eukprot:scaffold4124_cov267-Chaetoceros_neogracile.AAC.41
MRQFGGNRIDTGLNEERSSFLRTSLKRNETLDRMMYSSVSGVTRRSERSKTIPTKDNKETTNNLFRF